ncbi:MAG: hypothetical protein ACXVB4_17485 [Pseudobdellovibrionaceae bacterium]
MKIYLLLPVLMTCSMLANADDTKIEMDDPVSIFFIDSVRTQCPSEFQKLGQMSGNDGRQVLISSSKFPNGSVAVKIKVDTPACTVILMKRYGGVELEPDTRCVLNAKGSPSQTN